jgi:hypothetical protein
MRQRSLLQQLCHRAIVDEMKDIAQRKTVLLCERNVKPIKSGKIERISAYGFSPMGPHLTIN